MFVCTGSGDKCGMCDREQKKISHLFLVVEFVGYNFGSKWPQLAIVWEG
jgi:hypothetical protein